MNQRKYRPLIERAPRRDVEFGAFAKRLDGSEALMTVSNMSYDGCHLRGKESFRTGEKLDLALPRLGDICAEVRWSRKGSVGVSFITDEATTK